MALRSRHWALILSVALTMASGAPPIEPHHRVVRVPADTEIEIRLRKTLSSAESKVDERVEFEVVEEVRLRDVTVIPRGSLAWGVLTAVEPKSRLRKNGKIDLDLLAVCLPDGSAAGLRAVPRGMKHRGAVDTNVSDSVLALPALPVLLFLYGKDVVIPKGREFTAYLAEDVALDRTGLDRPAPGVCTPGADPFQNERADPETAALSTLAIRSNPEGAEILINGKFMGYTPSTLRLPAGEHQIKLLKPGKAAWDRLLVVTPGGDATIQAAMEDTLVVQR
ncbi:MAG: PEGA domain-containing protein [Bryobacteraceae bacterium]